MLLGGFFGVAVSLKKSPVWSPLIGYKAMKHNGSRREQACEPQVRFQVIRALGCHMEDPGYSDETVGGMKARIGMKRS